jgi:DNA adenine methylase
MQYRKLSQEIKSPLRYPGGKSRAISQIIPLIPAFREFREPFVGGGSVFLAIKQRMKEPSLFHINDLNRDLYCFWKILQTSPEEFVTAIRQIRMNYPDYQSFRNFESGMSTASEFDRAVRFFVINRSSFSGLSDSGGFSQQAFENRFTPSSIDRLAKVAPLLSDVQISNLDYESMITAPGKDVFIFLDPPYLKATKKRLYGKDGDLHLTFDHDRFAAVMQKCPHKWLITYDDSPRIRELFDFATIIEWELQYGMNNYKQGQAAKGKELFICNYDP